MRTIEIKSSWIPHSRLEISFVDVRSRITTPFQGSDLGSGVIHIQRLGQNVVVLPAVGGINRGKDRWHYKALGINQTCIELLDDVYRFGGQGFLCPTGCAAKYKKGRQDDMLFIHDVEVE